MVRPPAHQGLHALLGLVNWGGVELSMLSPSMLVLYCYIYFKFSVQVTSNGNIVIYFIYMQYFINDNLVNINQSFPLEVSLLK